MAGLAGFTITWHGSWAFAAAAARRRAATVRVVTRMRNRTTRPDLDGAKCVYIARLPRPGGRVIIAPSASSETSPMTPVRT